MTRLSAAASTPAPEATRYLVRSGGPAPSAPAPRSPWPRPCTGRIDTCFAHIMTGFGCRVLAFDPSPSDQVRRSAAGTSPSTLPVAEQSHVLTVTAEPQRTDRQDVALPSRQGDHHRRFRMRRPSAIRSVVTAVRRPAQVLGAG
jgi:hypothetical protein